MGRSVNWEAILYKEIEAARNIEFKYGVNDCTTWTARTVNKYYNIDWTPYWRNKKEALKAQKAEPMELQVDKVLGPRRANVIETKRGDIVQYGKGMDARLGICIGSQVVLLAKPKGICYVDLINCTYSWEIK